MWHPCWELQAGIVYLGGRATDVSLTLVLGCAIPVEELSWFCGAQAAHGVLKQNTCGSWQLGLVVFQVTVA